MNLELLGWNSALAYNFEPYAKDGYSVGRITLEYRGEYTLYSELGVLTLFIGQPNSLTTLRPFPHLSLFTQYHRSTTY